MTELLLASLWIALPVILGGICHVLVIKLNLWPGLARRPLDFGRTFRGRRIFGDNKTWRGVVAMIGPTAFWSLVLAVSSEGAAVRPLPALLWGAWLGLGYLVGELPNSFLKRQLDVAPGDTVRGPLRALFLVLDQGDSLLGVLAFMLLAAPVPVPPQVCLCLLAIGFIVHPTISFLMVKMGLKKRMG